MHITQFPNKVSVLNRVLGSALQVSPALHSSFGAAPAPLTSLVSLSGFSGSHPSGRVELLQKGLMEAFQTGFGGPMNADPLAALAEILKELLGPGAGGQVPAPTAPPAAGGGGAAAAAGGGGGGGAAPAGAGKSKGPETKISGAPAGFLWKPVSDNNGKLVILLPPGMKASKVTICGPDGQVLAQASKGGAQGKVANGNREHYRFDKPGSAFPPNCVVKADSGLTVRIPNPAQRNSGKG